MARKRLLIVDDHYELVDMLATHIREMGLELDKAHDGESGLEMALREDYDLVVLDRSLPEMDGLEVCRRIREKKKSLPILMLTSHAEEIDKVVGLEVGADDYVTKPFTIPELRARIKAILRRTDAIVEDMASSAATEECISIGELEIDLEKRRILLRQEEVTLTALEFNLVYFLASKAGKPFSRETLLREVWNVDFSLQDHSINSMVKRIRKKIEDVPNRPRYLLTVRGVGYRFAEDKEFH